MHVSLGITWFVMMVVVLCPHRSDGWMRFYIAFLFWVGLNWIGFGSDICLIYLYFVAMSTSFHWLLPLITPTDERSKFNDMQTHAVGMQMDSVSCRCCLLVELELILAVVTLTMTRVQIERIVFPHIPPFYECTYTYLNVWISSDSVHIHRSSRNFPYTRTDR